MTPARLNLTDEERRQRHNAQAAQSRARNRNHYLAQQRAYANRPENRARRYAKTRAWYHEPENKAFERLRARLKDYHQKALAAGLSDFEAVRLMVLAEIQFQRGETTRGRNWLKDLIAEEVVRRPVREAVDRKIRGARWDS